MKLKCLNGCGKIFQLTTSDEEKIGHGQHGGCGPNGMYGPSTFYYIECPDCGKRVGMVEEWIVAPKKPRDSKLKSNPLKRLLRYFIS